MSHGASYLQLLASLKDVAQCALFFLVSVSKKTKRRSTVSGVQARFDLKPQVFASRFRSKMATLASPLFSASAKKLRSLEAQHAVSRSTRLMHFFPCVSISVSLSLSRPAAARKGCCPVSTRHETHIPLAIVCQHGSKTTSRSYSTWPKSMRLQQGPFK